MADDSTIRSTTVDNLPLETSIQFEKRTSGKDSDLLRDADLIPSQVGLDNLNPTLESQNDILFGINQTAPSYAGFEDPPEYHNQKGGLYEHDQAVPFIGSDNDIDRISDLIQNIKESTSKLTSAPGATAPTSTFGSEAPVGADLPPSPTAPAGEIEAVKKEADTIQSMVSEISSINRILKDTNGARAGFQKG